MQVSPLYCNESNFKIYIIDQNLKKKICFSNFNNKKKESSYNICKYYNAINQIGRYISWMKIIQDIPNRKKKKTMIKI